MSENQFQYDKPMTTVEEHYSISAGRVYLAYDDNLTVIWRVLPGSCNKAICSENREFFAFEESDADDQNHFDYQLSRLVINEHTLVATYLFKGELDYSIKYEEVYINNYTTIHTEFGVTQFDFTRQVY